MNQGDFFANEKSLTIEKATNVKIELYANNGSVTTLKEKLSLQEGEIIDATVMNIKKLIAFIEKEIKAAKEQDVLFSLHMKATMMKVSDPIIFGHVVKVYYKEVFEKYAAEFAKLGVDANNGIGDVYNKVASSNKREEIEAAIKAVYAKQPALAMVNSDSYNFV